MAERLGRLARQQRGKMVDGDDAEGGTRGQAVDGHRRLVESRGDRVDGHGSEGGGGVGGDVADDRELAVGDVEGFLVYCLRGGRMVSHRLFFSVRGVSL